MRARVELAVVLAASALGLASSAGAQPVPRPDSPPPVLNLVRTRLKPKASAAYATLEGQIARGYQRIGSKLYWICLQSPKDAQDVLYLNLYDTKEAADRAPELYKETIPRHADLVALQQRLAALTASVTSTLTMRRDDVDRPGQGVDFTTMRALRLTIFTVQQGREGEFLKAIRTATGKEGPWYVYEATDSSTYALITLKRSAFNRRDGPPIPRTLRRFRGVYIKAETHVYSVRPAMSHVSAAFAAANPPLWRPAPPPHH